METCYENRIMTEEERLKRKQVFVMLTEDDQEALECMYLKLTSIVVCTKSIDIKCREDDYENERRLVFTFYAKGPIKSPNYYLITVTDPQDLFLHFTSAKITHDKFIEITSRLNVNIPTVERNSTPFNASKIVPAHARRAREAALGYNPNEGAGGVVGVIAGDCLAGTQNEPDRYDCFKSTESHQLPRIIPYLFGGKPDSAL